jgi:NAD(P)H-dependent FMN reductase
VLYAAVPVEETRKILARINPWLLNELDDMLDEADDTDYEFLSYDVPAADTAADAAAADAEAAPGDAPAGDTGSARD